MSGNCATGIASIARMPANVMTIETTNASRGRSMKMSEIMGSPSAPRRGLHHQFLHRLAGAHLLNAVDDHVLACLEARRDDHIGVAVGAGMHRAPLDLVLAVDDERIVAGLIDLEGRLRDDKAWLFAPLLDHRGDELAVDQQAVGVGNRRPRMISVSVVWSTCGSVRFQAPTSG